MHIPSIKYTATKLQCISNYKLRIESSKNESRLGRLLGHISIYDAVREWRQSQAKASISNIMEATKKFPSPAPVSQSPLRPVQEEPESQQSENELQTYLRQSQVQSFQDFQAAIELQIATMEQVKAAHRQLQQMAADANEDGDEVEEYESDSEINSDYDSYDGEEADWRSEEGSDSEDSMTDPESARSECASPMDDADCENEGDYFNLQPLTPMMSAC